MQLNNNLGGNLPRCDLDLFFAMKPKETKHHSLITTWFLQTPSQSNGPRLDHLPHQSPFVIP